MLHGAAPASWFDGHLDLTYIALHGRDLSRAPSESGGTLQPASLTFHSLAAAHVTRAFSTLFVRQKTPHLTADYTFTTPQEAHQAALHQLHMHHTWQSAGHIQLAANPQLPITNYQLPMPDSQIENQKSKIKNPPLLVHLAMEGTPLRHLDDANLFHAAGVRMLSLAWAEGSPWSGGDQSPPGNDDLTPSGRQLIPRLDSLGIIHDVSHLADRAFWSLLETATGPVVASHSNCRSLLPGSKSPQRHLSDDQLRALAQRPNSLIGLNLYARFILPPDQLATRRATIADLLRHIDHIEQITARRDLLALGTDFDSGFTTDLLPSDLQSPQHLLRLADALSQANWSDEQITCFANNWCILLPASPSP